MRNNFTLSLIICLFASLSANATPASSKAMSILLHDNTVVEGHLMGDENHSYFIADNTNMLYEASRGMWTPIWREGRILKNEPADLEILREEGMTAKRQALHAPMKRLGSLDSEGRSQFPTISDDVHSPVVLIEYQDRSFSFEDINERIGQMCNQEGYSDFGACGSARDYFIACSHGKFKPTFDIYGPVKVSEKAAYYIGDNGRNGRFAEALHEAMSSLIESGELDLSKYDYDHDGISDNVFFYYAGYGQADTGDATCIWPHQSYYTSKNKQLGLPDVECNGVMFDCYACANELLPNPPAGSPKAYLAGIGTFCHEFSHVLGLPDFYDVNGGTTVTPGKWTLMDMGCYNLRSTQPPLFSAYEQWLCRWLEMPLAADGESFELQSLSAGNDEGAAVKIATPTHPDEYYVLECRTRDGWDTSLGEEGLVMWHIDFDASAWKTGVNINDVPRVEIVGCQTAEKNRICFPVEGDLLTTTLYPEGINSLAARHDDSFQPYITSINFDRQEKKASFEYNVISSLPTGFVTIHEPTKNADGLRRFTLTWDTYEGATDYMLSVCRYDKKGNRIVVDEYEDTPVGNINSIEISGISSTAWDQTFEASVRIFDRVPGQYTSNVIRFVPSQLTADSGVKAVSTRTMPEIYVENGTIQAPANARIFTADGRAIGRNAALPNGIYIVVCDEVSVKVHIR